MVDLRAEVGASRVRRKQHSAGALLLAATLLLAGCSTHSGGDPGNKRLHELARDPVFAALPPGARHVRIVKTPAHYDEPGFTGGGWNGASVVTTFIDDAPPRTVYRFYGARAAAAGWHGTKSGPWGFTDTWMKTYPDGAQASLMLLGPDIRLLNTPREYSLNSGVTALPS